MGLDALELALFAVADLDVYGVMPEAMSQVPAAVKTAKVHAAIADVLSWIPNAKRPISEIDESLMQDIGLVASFNIILANRGLSGNDMAIVENLQRRIDARRELIMHSGTKDGIRLTFVDATPDEDDFAPLGATHAQADDWAEP